MLMYTPLHVVTEQLADLRGQVDSLRKRANVAEAKARTCGDTMRGDEGEPYVCNLPQGHEHRHAWWDWTGIRWETIAEWDAEPAPRPKREPSPALEALSRWNTWLAPLERAGTLTPAHLDAAIERWRRGEEPPSSPVTQAWPGTGWGSSGMPPAGAS